MAECVVIICACLAILMIMAGIGFAVFGILNPCHPSVHAIKQGNFCIICGEQLRTICVCGHDASGSNFCRNCGLAVRGG